MSDFSENQLKELTKKLDRSRVQQREANGRVLDYLEGWFAIAEANSIFGYGGWDRVMVHCEQVFQTRVSGFTKCAYLARIRIRVRANKAVVIREGTGFGQASSSDAAEAHEQAVKSAETDATKRALATFGNRFGLSLYDPDRAGVTKPVQRRTGNGEAKQDHSTKRPYELIDPDGNTLAKNLSAEGFCTGLRQLIQICPDRASLMMLKAKNAEAVVQLRQLEPDLRNTRGEHYADILERLLERRLQESEEQKDIHATAEPEAKTPDNPDPGSEKPEPVLPPSRIGTGSVIDKSQLPISTTSRRVRSKAYLSFVASKPCLICEQIPCHAHHVTFAQPRGLSVKVSDEFTVPLCAVHHNELHGFANERAWWRKYKIDPLHVAKGFWDESRNHSDTAPAAASVAGATKSASC